MRSALHAWMLDVRDSGFIPEADLTRRAGVRSIYELMRSEDVPLERIIDSAEEATSSRGAPIETLIDYLQSDDSAVRYWGATGLLIAGDGARPAVAALMDALNDSSRHVVVVAAQVLYGLGERQLGRSGLKAVLLSRDPMARTHAMNVIESVGDNSDEIRRAVIAFARAEGELTRSDYDHRAARRLMALWNVDPEDHGIRIDW